MAGKENRRCELQTEAEKISKNSANNGKKSHACDSSEHLIKTCTTQKKNIFAWYENGSEVFPFKSCHPSNLGPPHNSALQCPLF